MRKLLIGMLLCTTLFNQSLKAQYYYYNNKYYENAVVFEIGAAGGVMNALTDLGGKKGVGKNFIKDLRWKTTRPSYGVYFLANYLDKLSLRLEGTFGEVVSYDSILKNVASTTFGRYERNLSFKSRISEFQLALEVHPLMFKDYDDEVPPSFSAYAVGGVGYFSFDPQTQLNGVWHRLQPLSLEGQGFKEYKDRIPYQLSQVNLVYGLGIRYQITPMFNAKVEFAQRKLFTDYLDDVSKSFIDPNLFANYLTPTQASTAQKLYNRTPEIVPSDVPYINEERGDPKDNDSYFTIQFKIGMTLGRQKR
jgi:hypothetical protein